MLSNEQVISDTKKDSVLFSSATHGSVLREVCGNMADELTVDCFPGSLLYSISPAAAFNMSRRLNTLTSWLSPSCSCILPPYLIASIRP